MSNTAKLFLSGLCATLIGSVASNADAQSLITFEDVQIISSAAEDVETGGTLVLAIDAGGGGGGINTVTGQDGLTVDFVDLSTTEANALVNFSTTFADQAGFGGGSSDYGGVVDDGYFIGGNADADNFDTDTVVFSGLIPGNEYLVQWWAQDAGRPQNFFTILEDSVFLNLDNSPDDDFGSFVVGTFIADASGNQSIDANGELTGNAGAGPGRTQLNAIQLRNITAVVPEPTSATLIGVGFAGLALRRRRSK